MFVCTLVSELASAWRIEFCNFGNVPIIKRISLLATSFREVFLLGSLFAFPDGLLPQSTRHSVTMAEKPVCVGRGRGGGEGGHGTALKPNPTLASRPRKGKCCPEHRQRRDHNTPNPHRGRELGVKPRMRAATQCKSRPK